MWRFHEGCTGATLKNSNSEELTQWRFIGFAVSLLTFIYPFRPKDFWGCMTSNLSRLTWSGTNQFDIDCGFGFHVLFLPLISHGWRRCRWRCCQHPKCFSLLRQFWCLGWKINWLHDSACIQVGVFWSVKDDWFAVCRKPNAFSSCLLDCVGPFKSSSIRMLSVAIWSSKRPGLCNGSSSSTPSI